MDDSTVKQGQLSYLSKGSLIKKYKEYYVLLVGASRSGLARLEIFEACKGNRSNNHVLVLVSSDIVKVIQEDIFSRNKGRGFIVTTRKQQHYFLARSATESEKWVKAIQDTLLKSLTTSTTLAQADPSRNIMKENEIYMSSEEVLHNFSAEVVGETRMKLRVEGPVRVLVGDGNITIVSMEGKMVVRWAICHLRKFGFTEDNFHLEVGRKSDFGPGVFIFMTPQGKGISKLVHQEKEYLKYHMMTKVRNSSPTVPCSPSQTTAPTSVLPPGHASTTSSDPLILGDHIYESIETKKPELSFSGFEEMQGRSGPKVSSIHSVTSLEGHIWPLKHERAVDSRKSNESLDSSPLFGTKSTKSRPTKLAPKSSVAWNVKGLQASFDFPQSKEHIYSNLEDVQNAWKVHGYGSMDHMDSEDDGNYDVLEFLKPIKNEERLPAASTDCREESSVTESIYSQINPKMKKNCRAANSENNST